VVLDATSSLTSPTLGTQVQFNVGSTRANRITAIERLEDNKGLIIGAAKPDVSETVNAVLKIAVYTVSGTSISFGTVYDVDGSSVPFKGNSTEGRLQICTLSSTTAVVFWQSNDGNLYARYMTISGTNISFGTKTRVTTFQNVPFHAAATSATQIAFSCINPLDLNKHYVSIINATSSSITTVSQNKYTDFGGYDNAYIQQIYDSTKGALIGVSAVPTGSSYITQAVVSSI
jgi:hypothetical protein